MELAGLKELGAAGILDLVVLGLVLLSGVLAMLRGFVHEVLSILGWVGAVLSAIYLYPLARPVARDFISMTLIADLLTFAVVFVVSFAVLSVVSNVVARKINHDGVDTLDRTLGFTFGLARGAVFLCLTYITVTFVFPAGRHPDWVGNSRTVPLLDTGSAMLRAALPEELVGSAVARLERETAGAIGEAYRGPIAPIPEIPAEPPRFDGYSSSQRLQLNDLADALSPPATRPVRAEEGRARPPGT